MNKDVLNVKAGNFYKKISGKIKDIIILSVLAIALIFTAWMIFHAEEAQDVASFQPTETEARVMQLLQEMDGVGDANVMIYETEEGIHSVAVVCEGANDFQVVMNIRSAVAAALGTKEKNIRVYLKKE